MLAICMMMAAEMYGMMPISKMPKRARAPPENMLNSASMLPACWSKNAASAAGSTPGTGTNVPTRKTISAPMRNAIRFLSSPSLLAVLAAAAGFCLGFLATSLPFDPYSMLPPAASIAARAFRHRQAFDLDGLFQFARGDDFHLASQLRHQPRLLQDVDVDDLGVGDRELVQAQLRRPPAGERAETDLRQAPLQRHLAALEAHLVVAARARVLALGAAPGGLALAGRVPAADPLAVLFGAPGRLQRFQSHRLKLPLPGGDTRPG